MRYLILCIVFFATGVAMSQSQAYQALQSSMTNNKGAMVMSVSKDLLSMIDLNLTEDSATYKKITGSLEEVKLILCGKYLGGIDAFTRDVTDFLPGRLYDEVKEDESGQPIGEGKILVLRKGLKIKECHLILGGADSGMVISFFGDFHLRDLNALREKAQALR